MIDEEKETRKELLKSSQIEEEIYKQKSRTIASAGRFQHQVFFYKHEKQKNL